MARYVKTVKFYRVRYAERVKFYKILDTHPLRKKCWYSEFFFSVISHVWTEYGDLLCTSLCLVRMQDQQMPSRKSPNTTTFHTVL